MKPWIGILSALLLLTGCAAPAARSSPPPAPTLPPAPAETVRPTPEPSPSPTPAPEEDLFPRSFQFCSGAGAWATDLTIQADGSFSGAYLDADMGSSGEDYNGTEYRCNFSGTFTQPERVDDFTYSMTLESIEYEQTPGDVVYENGIWVIYSGPYGLEHAKEVLVYLPGADLARLPEEFCMWTYSGREGELAFYGLYNVEDQQGFSEYEPSPNE